MDDDTTSDALGDLLTATRPLPDPLPSEMAAEVARMSLASRTEARTSRRGGRVAAVTLSAVLVLGGAGAAAAASVDAWGWWKKEPPGPYTFVLPSGATCSGTFDGVVHGPSPVTSDLANQFLRSVELTNVVDVAPEIRELRATTGGIRHKGETVETPAGNVTYLTDGPISADSEYFDAFHNAVLTALVAELDRHGYDVDESDLYVPMQTGCPEGKW